MIKRQQPTEISSGGGSSATQNEIYQIFEGTNPQGLAAALFETTSGSNSSLADVNYNSDQKLSNINTNTGNSATYLSTIRTPVIISTSASGTIAPQIHNVSFYNSGSATGTITVNGTTINLPTGVSINYNAGGNNNRYSVNIFSYNATGTTFLISYTQ